jgi:hypothetical protein
MSYEVAEQDGQLLGQFASGGGYDDFITAVEGGDYPALLHLVTYGQSSSVPAALKELKQLEKEADEDLASTCKSLAALIKGQHSIIITDGTCPSDASQLLTTADDASAAVAAPPKTKKAPKKPATKKPTAKKRGQQEEIQRTGHPRESAEGKTRPEAASVASAKG